MAPELFVTMEANELQEKAAKIREWQRARKLSDNQIVKKFEALGSTKTFKRILDGDLSELSLTTQLANYRSVWAFIESIGDDRRTEEEIYKDLFPTIELERCFREANAENGPARAIFLLGPSGSGKTKAQERLLDEFGTRLLKIEATVVWNDSPMAMLGTLLDRLGIKEKPMLQVERLGKVVEKLNETRRCVLIDEGHHLGPRCLNLIITLINQTPGEFVIAAIDTLWRKLETGAYEECRQLTGNRMAERINLGGQVQEKDVQKLITRRVEWANGEANQVVRYLCEKANSYGRLAFVREVIKRANEKADGEPMTKQLFIDAIAEEVASR